VSVLTGSVHAAPDWQAPCAPVTIRVGEAGPLRLAEAGALEDAAESDRNHPLPVPRASVTDVLRSSSVGFRLTTVTDGLDIVRPPPVIAMLAVDACATPMFVAVVAVAAAQTASDTTVMRIRFTTL
jgi:hypothetical protein